MSKKKVDKKPQMPEGMGKKRGAKNAKKTLGRLLGYVIKGYPVHIIVVLACVFLSAFATTQSSKFLQTLIDQITNLSDQIKAGASQSAISYDPLKVEIIKIVIIYVLGIVSTFLSNFILVSVAQGVLKKIREDMFAKMQNLPIKYFDTNSFGDIMSHYTNDTDAIEQLIGQSLPNVVSSFITIILSFITMLVTSWQLTIVVLITLVLMLSVIKRLGGKSAKYFMAQQKSVGKLNGFIEEMSNGQKVVKVFNHEPKAKADFDALNEELCSNMTNAHTYANVFMPIMANLNYAQYVVLAMVGGVLALKYGFATNKQRSYGACWCRTCFRAYG